MVTTAHGELLGVVARRDLELALEEQTGRAASAECGLTQGAVAGALWSTRPPQWSSERDRRDRDKRYRPSRCHG
jgi:phage gp29-like protein